MKNLAALLVAALCAASVLAQTGTTALAENPFVSKEGGFEIVAPIGFDKLKLTSSTKKTDMGDLTISNYLQSTERGAVMIAFTDFRELVFYAKSTKELLNDAVRGIKTQGCVVSNRENKTVDGYPATAFDVRASRGDKNLYSRTVVVIARPRSYTFQFLSYDQAELEKPDVKKYFSSLRIQK